MVGTQTGDSIETSKIIHMKICFFVLMTTFLLCLHANAQQPDSIRIPAIPRGLYWENSAKTFSVKGNDVVIVAGEKTDMFRDPNVTNNTDSAPKLLFEGEENCVLIASIEHAFASKWDGGALVVKQDSLHWIKFCFEKDYTGAKRVVSGVTNDISDDCTSKEMKSDKVFYKVAKAGNVITLYCSENGAKWFLIRHLQFDARKGFKLGFLAQSPTGDRCEVKFSNISYK